MAGLQIINNQRVYHDAFTAMSNISRRAVKSGCEVTEHSPTPDMSVDISSGSVYFGSLEVAVTGTNVAIAASDPSNDRMDLVVVNSSGVVSILDGTSTQSPTDPRPPVLDIETYVVLARIYVDDGVTSIVDSKITDLRVFFTIAEGGTTGDVIPGTDDFYDLGSGSYRWQDLFIAGVINSDGDINTTNILANGILDVNGNISASSAVNVIGNITTNGNLVVQKENSYLASLAVSDVSDYEDLSSLSNLNYIELENVGSFDCYINLDTSAALTDFLLSSGEKIILENVSFSDVAAICNTGETTTLNITAYSGDTAGTRSNKEIASISATDSSASHTFTDTTSYKDVVIKNEGISNSFIEVGATATLSDRLLKAGKTMVINNMVVSQIAAICNTGETTTIKLFEVH